VFAVGAEHADKLGERAPPSLLFCVTSSFLSSVCPVRLRHYHHRLLLLSTLSPRIRP
jgi:hypothetical protein